MGIYLGIDGGGTKTEFVVSKEDGQIVDNFRLGPSNALLQGNNLAYKTLITGLKRVYRQYGKIEAAAFCIPGISHLRMQLEMELKEVTNKILFMGDEWNALSSGLAGEDGIVAQLGTGSFVIGRYQGKIGTIGGYGPLLGEPGSGYAFALKAIALAIKHFELEKETALVDEVLSYFEVEKISELKTALYKPECTRQKVAGFSNRVKQCLQDEEVRQLYSEIASEIVEYIWRLVQKLEIQKTSCPLVITGGLTSLGAGFVSEVERNVRKRTPQLIIAKPKMSPSSGALLWAIFGETHCYENKIIENIMQTEKRI